MKLTSFNCTIEVSKDENGYSNNYYVDVTDKGVSISHPYVTQTPEQVMFITQLVHDFIGVALGFNGRIDGFNRDMGLEEYAPKVSQTEELLPESASEPAVPQPSRGGSDQAAVAEQIGKDYEEAVEERSLAKTIEDNVIESLGLR